MPRNTPPTRTLRDRPDLDQLKRQAKELLDAFRAGHPEATKEVHAHYRQADLSTFALHDAQLVMARAHGFDSWPKLKAFVDGATVRRLVEAVRNGDLDTVRSMVTARPELVHLDVAENDEHRALHYAVLRRRPEIVRFLMQHGADARKGIWPHRAATTAITLAVERGYDEVVGIIEEEESRRSASAPLRALAPTVAAGLIAAVRHGDQDATIATVETRTAIATGDAAWLRTASCRRHARQRPRPREPCRRRRFARHTRASPRPGARPRRVRAGRWLGRSRADVGRTAPCVRDFGQADDG